VNKSIECFKAYDIRGKVPEELNSDVAYRVGRAYVEYLGTETCVVGHDVRLTSEELTNALVKGLTDAGADVIDIGQCGTEEVYFATFHLETDGGICVTASHNPMDYNGMKLVKKGARPISGDNGLDDIKAIAEAGKFRSAKRFGVVEKRDIREAYVQHLLSYIDVSRLKPLKVVCNAGNGGAGAIVDALEAYLPFKFVKIHHQPDGSFPNGIPNPLLPDRRQSTIDAVRENKADLGIAWDGDFDRCFFFDENGDFIEGYYVVGLLAKAFLAKNPNARVVHDPRLIWNTIDLVESAGGIAVQSKTGHAFIKTVMRDADAIYGGEMSAHHYFKSFAYCDNGSIPWLLVLELMCVSGQKLSQMVADRMQKYPCSGEINRTVKTPSAILDSIKRHYADEAVMLETVDGVSMCFERWRFNVRMSSTEPVLRLNVESRGDSALVTLRTEEVLALIDRFDHPK